jgi:hypothetical protein
VKDLNFTLITTIQTVHNADKLDARAGQARNDSGYDHPWIGIETSIEQVIADYVLGNQCDKGSDHRFGCHTERCQAEKQGMPCFRHTSFSFPLTKSPKRRSEPAQLKRARRVPAITLSSSIDGRRLGRRDGAKVAIGWRQNGVTSCQRRQG